MDLANRFPENPLLPPEGLKPSDPRLKVECVLNPGVFRFQEKVFLLVSVAERPQQIPGQVRIPVHEDGQLEILEVDAADPELDILTKKG